MRDNITIAVVESQVSEVALLNTGSLQGMGMALGVGSIGFVGFIVRLLFIYYIKFEAQKERPINTLMLHDQIIQATTMLSVTSLTTMSLGTQTPIRDTFGQYGCHFYWTSSKAYDWGMGTSGSGMAIYRLICFHYLFKRNLNQKAMTKYILIAECTLSFLSISCNAACFNMFGWEKAIFYQFCMNYGAEKVDVIHQYESKDFDVSLYWILRFGPNIVAQVMIIVELGIYVWIIWHLKRHDDDNVKMKIITEHMRQERHQKNVITLKGQAAGFIVEMAYVTYVAIHSTNFSLVDPSIMPISQIIAATTISVAQLLASHEMKRFLKNKFNL